jgi:prepilin-type N-terminal cleavage/methylation domain-containing protein
MLTKPKTKAKQGFTLIELLVVISIIGLLSTLAVVALNNARVRSRDAARMANIQQLQTALQLYYDANNTWDFPSQSTCGNATNNIVYSNCGSTGANGLGDFMQVAVIKDPLSTASAACPNSGSFPAGGCQIAFTAATTSTAFNIGFCIETGQSNLAAGCHALTQSGLQ